MDANISVFVVCVEAIIYVLLYKMDDSTFKSTYWWFVLQFMVIRQSFEVL